MEKIIEHIRDKKNQSLINMIENDQKVVGTYCTFSPKEIIKASGAVPVSLCSMDDSTIPVAEQHLPANSCSLIKSSYGYAITDRCPYFYAADFIVGETTCDGKKKMYEYLDLIKKTHVMQLPYNRNLKESHTYWKQSIIRLQKDLEKYYNVTITKAKISSAINKQNRRRSTIQKTFELMKKTPAAITGKELYQAVSLSKFIFDDQEAINALELFIKKSEVNTKEIEGPRIMLTGCPIGKATEKLIDIVESNGGIVVFFENCTVTKEEYYLVDESIDPVDALTEHYLKIPCSCMSPNTTRYDRVIKASKEYNVDGVIDMNLHACHTYAIEKHGLEKALDIVQMPYLSIETDYSQKDKGQLETRIGAFIEML